MSTTWVIVIVVIVIILIGVFVYIEYQKNASAALAAANAAMNNGYAGSLPSTVGLTQPFVPSVNQQQGVEGQSIPLVVAQTVNGNTMVAKTTGVSSGSKQSTVSFVNPG